MDADEQRAKAERFRALHLAPPILVLPNVWDVASARVFASLPQCRAIATASAAIAPSLGYDDHEGTPPHLMIEAVGRIAQAVDVPVTADLEAGYGDVARTVEAAIDAGVVGLNIEDASRRPVDALVGTDVQTDRIRTIRRIADRRGVRLVINARTDVFLEQVDSPQNRVALAAERGRAYLEAGADCIFVPGVRDVATIAALVGAIDGPVSVLARAGSPPVPELEQLGVARVSIGPGAFRATLALLEQVGRNLFEEGTYP